MLQTPENGPIRQDDSRYTVCGVSSLERKESELSDDSVHFTCAHGRVGGSLHDSEMLSGDVDLGIHSLAH